jgi:hypothetical protein
MYESYPKRGQKIRLRQTGTNVYPLFGPAFGVEQVRTTKRKPLLQRLFGVK